MCTLIRYLGFMGTFFLFFFLFFFFLNTHLYCLVGCLSLIFGHMLFWVSYRHVFCIFYLHLLSAVEHVSRGKALLNTLLIKWGRLVGLSQSRSFVFVGCLTSQQQASVSQGWTCSDNFTCCHTEIEVADPTFYLTQSQYTDTGPTSPSTDPITPGAWQGSHWSANV